MKFKNIRFMPDYGCWPLWDIDNFGDIDPKQLPITRNLQNQIKKWAKEFDSILDLNDPGNSGGFKTENEEKIFAEEGWLIFKELRKQLPNINIVIKGFVFEKFPDSTEFKEKKY